MPEMDGYEATMCIRQLDSVEMRSVPIIAMTASAIRGDREKCLNGERSEACVVTTTDVRFQWACQTTSLNQ
jgi:CheY-like chemotaxis protein